MRKSSIVLIQWSFFGSASAARFHRLLGMFAKCLNRSTSAGCFCANWVDKCTAALTCKYAGQKRRFVPARSWTTKPRAKTSNHTKNLEVDAEPVYTALTESTVKPSAADKALPVSLLYGSIPAVPPLVTAINSIGSF